jgi:hypothetical protein
VLDPLEVASVSEPCACLADSHGHYLRFLGAMRHFEDEP